MAEQEATKALLGGCLSVLAGTLVGALIIVGVGWLFGLGLRLSGL